MKMELVGALLHRPKVIYLDEPTIGLDFTGQKVIRKFLLDYKKKFNPIIILTSHYMEDIESLCERIVIIKQGKKVYDGPLKKIQETLTAAKSVKIQLEKPITGLELLLKEAFPEFSKTDLQVLENHEGSLRLKVKKNLLSQVLPKLFEVMPIQDLTTVEEDIADLIEVIMAKGTDSLRNHL
jgi:ABC-2 type transport system ATP-binding protein